ncbi:MAG: murein L,D-transpeptidase catalytic domain family protein [Bacteriovorax sp.]|nr:murein L,D-transpeptidase catalytic domain family protein [Bacteriovorax sp.]
MLKISLTFITWLSLITSVFGNDYTHLDPDHLIPAKLLSTALTYFDDHLASIPNKRFIGLIDFKQHNSLERFYIVDMESGRVEKFLVAHGKNSDPDFDGLATKFSNINDSNMSSLGFYLTAETYSGAHGYSLRLDGLSSTNSNARARAIVIHAADYVAPGGKIGRSFGCPAVEPRYHQQIIDEIKEGSLLYAAF